MYSQTNLLYSEQDIVQTLSKFANMKGTESIAVICDVATQQTYQYYVAG